MSTKDSEGYLDPDNASIVWDLLISFVIRARIYSTESSDKLIDFIENNGLRGDWGPEQEEFLRAALKLVNSYRKENKCNN